MKNRSLVLICFLALGLVFTSSYGASDARAAGAVDIGAWDALAKLEKLAAELPVNAFANPKNRTALLNKIDAVFDQLEEGEYKGAANKLNNDIQDKINKWIFSVQQGPLTDALQVTLSAIDAASKTTVTTLYGKLAGADAGNGSWQWKGVPYAKPPVGELRWKAPQNPEPWFGVRYSTDQFTPAVQPGMSIMWIPQNKILGSEDCLYVNIFRPKNAQQNLPVFMWIHGGSNWFGGAAGYDGSILASQMNMVVVVIQYRLGPFGWFYMPAINSGGTPEDLSGDYGTLDTIQVLKWIKGNIAGFGGNPNNVTVAGQSAGAANTYSIVGSPLSAGLFHRAMPVSGGMPGASIATCTAQAVGNINQLLVNDGTCADLATADTYRKGMSPADLSAYLRGKPAYEIEKARMNARGSIDSVSPCADGYVLPASVSALVTAGTYNKVPIMVGATQWEMKDFVPLYYGTTTTSTGKTWLDVYNVLNGNLAFDALFATQADKGAYEAKAYSMSPTGLGTTNAAKLLSAKQDNVFTYLFQWGGIGSGPHSNGFDFIIGPAHACDIPFWFGWNRDLFGYSFIDNPASPEYNKPGRVGLQNAMMSYMGQFAATGNPNKAASALPLWTAWSNAADAKNFMIFDATLLEAKVGMNTLP